MKHTTKKAAWAWIKAKQLTPEQAALALAQMVDLGLLTDETATAMMQTLQRGCAQ